MTLAELITALEAADPDRVVPHGFTNPHSYRGYYNELAFEPAANVTVSDMLEDARLALGSTYEGWKGGDFTMSEHTECWLSQEGDASGDTISALLLQLMLAELPPADAASTPPVAPLAASQPSEAPVEGETATRPPTGPLRDSLGAESSNPYANGVCTYGEDQAPGSGCIKPAGHNGAHLVTPGDTDDDL